MSLPAGVEVGRPRLEDAARLARVHVQCWREAYATLLPESFSGEEALAPTAVGGAGDPRARRFYAKNGFVPDGLEQADPVLDVLVEIRMVR